MSVPLQVLIVEDSENDAMLLVLQLRRGPWEVVHQRVDTRDAMRAALDAHPWDIIIADYSMPCFSAAVGVRSNRYPAENRNENRGDYERVRPTRTLQCGGCHVSLAHYYE